MHSDGMVHSEEGDDGDMEADSQPWEKKKRKRPKRHTLQEVETSDDDVGDRDNKKVRNRSDGENEGTTTESGSGAADPPRDSASKKEGEAGQLPASPTNRVRLLFPNDSGLNYNEKLLWTVKMGRAFKTFQPLLKEGKHRPYVTVGSQEAVKMLTTSGYEGVVLKLPDQREKLSKVIIFRYPLVLDPDFLLDDPRFAWAKRNVVKGEQRNQIIAVMRGEVPEKVFITGAGYRRVAPYVDEPAMCLRCCRWGHMAWKCQEDPRCRFCARKHPSSVCGDKIKAGTRVIPRCCNCGGEHNARNPACPRKPFVQRRVEQGTGERGGSRDMRAHPSTQPQRSGNAWEDGGEAGVASRQREEARRQELVGAAWPALPGGGWSHPGGKRGPDPAVVAHVTGPLVNPSSHISPSVEPATQPVSPSPAQTSPPTDAGPVQPRRTAEDSNGEIIAYMKQLEKKIDAIDRRVSDYIKTEKDCVRPTVPEQEAVSGTATREETCMTVTNTTKVPLLSVGVDFETLLHNWERSGRKRDSFVKNWSEIQRCLNIAKELLESVANVNKTDNIQPEHGSQ